MASDHAQIEANMVVTVTVMTMTMTVTVMSLQLVKPSALPCQLQGGHQLSSSCTSWTAG